MSNNLSLKCQRFTPSGCEDIGIRIFDFVANTQFLYVIPPLHFKPSYDFNLKRDKNKILFFQ